MKFDWETETIQFWFGFSLVNYVSVRICGLKLNWTEQNWTELNWTELNWTELNWSHH